jgi:hypothetical protein
MEFQCKGTTKNLGSPLEMVVSSEQTPCLFGLISRISSHPAVFFSHNKPANSAFSTINQRNEQAESKCRRENGY